MMKPIRKKFPEKLFSENKNHLNQISKKAKSKKTVTDI